MDAIFLPRSFAPRFPEFIKNSVIRRFFNLFEFFKLRFLAAGLCSPMPRMVRHGLGAGTSAAAPRIFP
jgi:hypothetical protein